eukprot:TRINITY_DN35137_c0_g1_i1.p1 TRINITY_DN35137_c0_g1~~TRINITY_DN35137_c0_g1_i1.p1  ORF type:complete len:416 (+),score=51.78 TRINITY_DN35137_c0_g1_i1:152-1399(+)
MLVRSAQSQRFSRTLARLLSGSCNSHDGGTNPSESCRPAWIDRARLVMTTPSSHTEKYVATRRFWHKDWQRMHNGRIGQWAWGDMIRAVVSSRMPLRATAYYTVYSSAITLPFLFPKQCMEFVCLDNSKAEHILIHCIDQLNSHHVTWQSVTTFLASALFLMLSFRCNRSYVRWWEAGSEYAGLLSAARKLTLTAQLAITDKALATEVAMLSYAHVRGVEFHLRRVGDDHYTESLRYLLTPPQLQQMLAAPQRPLWLAQHLTLTLSRAYDAKLIKNVRLLVALMNDVEKLMERTQSLQRLGSLPEPWTYQKHMRLTTQLWLGMLPLALLPSLSAATPLLATSIAYTVYKLDDVSVELTLPFGHDRSDLSICMYGDALQREVWNLIEVYIQDQGRSSIQNASDDVWEAWGGKPPND